MSEYLKFGIDLGTTNSCIAIFENDAVRVFRNNDQMNVTPSAVRVEKSGRVIIGRRAYATRHSNPENCAIEFKRWIGQKDKFVFASSGREVSAEELSAEILKSLLSDVQMQTGASPDAAVITVPAAFGQLQCEATARAAVMAGLHHAPLLQEPIAAAVAYGIKPGAEGQRWLVFDLGGGTFDVAIVSSRDGQLNVLDHRGNNHLGGKDIDNEIVNAFLIPELAKHYNLPDANKHPERYRSLIHRLQAKAEEAKIDLSTRPTAVLSIFDVGHDMDESSIEAELELTVPMLVNLSAPVLEKCATLTREVIAGARLEAKNIDRILLVGGPTQMPVLRQMLQQGLQIPIDCSLDPMTVVAQGAAIFASAIEKPPAPSISASCAPQVQNPGSVKLVLAYEPVTTDLKPIVAGRVEYPEDIQLRFDSQSGHWTSGWISTESGTFEETFPLMQGKTTQFWIYARDNSGKNLELDQTSFSIRHGLTVSAPPLPHTISIEVVKADGTSELDPLLKRNSPLPNEATKVYRCHKTLKPSEPDEIALKLWEGEELNEPFKNELVGTLNIKSSRLRRVLPEGSEIELSIRFDTSRLIRVDAFIPALNEHFSEQVYVPETDEEVYADQAKKLDKQVEHFYDKLSLLENSMGCNAMALLRGQLEGFDLQLQKNGTANRSDPDKAKQLVTTARKLESDLETQRTVAVNSSAVDDVKYKIDSERDLIEQHGSQSERREMELLIRDLERAAGRSDKRSIQKINESFNQLIWRVLFRQEWYWAQVFEYLTDGSHNFTNTSAANSCISQGKRALAAGDHNRLRSAVQELWKLLPLTEGELEREKSMQAGIRRF